MSYSTPLALFDDRADADLPLADVAQSYFDYLAGREQPASKATIVKYRETLVSFAKSLVLHGKPTVISSVTLLTVRLWVADMRAGTLPTARVGRPTDKCTDGSIGPRYAALKAFTSKFVHKELKLTTRDLLEDLPRWKGKGNPKEMLTDTEIAAIRDSFSLPSFEHVRDRAIFEMTMATAFRYATVIQLPLASLDRLSGRVTVTTKGGRVMQGRIDPKAMVHVRTYVRLRPETTSPAMFVTNEGKALTYDGGREIWRRMGIRSGVTRLGPHLIRHTYAQRMAAQGAPLADIQDVLGHASDKMARHYAGAARTYAAGDTMTKYSLSA